MHLMLIQVINMLFCTAKKSLLKHLRSTVKISPLSFFLSRSLITVKAVILVTSCYQDQDPDTGLSLLIALGLLASDLNRFL